MVSDGADLSRNPLQVASAILREEGTTLLFLGTLPKRCSGVHTVNDMTGLIKGLYRGTLPRVIRAIMSGNVEMRFNNTLAHPDPNHIMSYSVYALLGAVQFATYEITQSYLQK